LGPALRAQRGGDMVQARVLSRSRRRYRAKVTFTTATAPSSATGKVTFGDGSAKLGTATLKRGVATFSTTTLSVGTHEITAICAGNSHHPGSKSAKLAQKVTRKGKVVVTPRHAPLESKAATASVDLIGRRLAEWSL
jgi:hypothetical protein